MSPSYRVSIVAFSKIYLLFALLVAAVFSPSTLSFTPLLLFGFYLYGWWRPFNLTINLLLNFFIFFTLTVLFQPVVGLFSPLISLPLLLAINHSLVETSVSLKLQESRHLRRPTNICLTLFLIALLTLGTSLTLSNVSLSFSCVAILVYLINLVGVVMHGMSSKPIEEAKIRKRLVAGSKDRVQIKLWVKTRVGGRLFLKSPYEWLRINPEILSLKEKNLRIDISLSPPLSGPARIKLSGYVIDQWGLIQSRFEIEPMHLYVIPRARYAAWLIRKYLEGSRPEKFPLISTPGLFKATSDLRQGIEYYGSRLYQPGDSLKVIDWKHSLKLSQLVAKEFSEIRGQSATVLINLVVTDAEEADKLAYKILITAISLARENIPATLAAYDHEKVKLTTSMLHPQALLLQSLEVAQQMVTFVDPLRYLSPPDVMRLRANLSRIKPLESETRLAQLLQLEYKSLEDNAKLNPVSQALLEGLTKGEKGANLVIISQRNHDAEALAFNIFSFSRKGHAIVEVEV